MQLRSSPPKVKLVKTFQTPFANAVATARTCYSSRIITDADVEKNPEQRDRIARSIYLAGHHTTLQHAHFQFALENVSRQALWGFFHAHPFYNSEQVSQRYVEVKPGRVLLAETGDQNLNALFEKAVVRQMRVYHLLNEQLRPAIEAVYFGIFPGRKTSSGEAKKKAYASAIKKKCQEAARYVLPVGTFAHLYHTISGITLHRYNRLAHSLDCPTEQRLIIDAMVKEVNDNDPTFFRDIEDTLELADTHEALALKALAKRETPRERTAKFCKNFDDSLGKLTSKLISYSTDSDQLLGDAVREVFGLLDDELSNTRAVEMLIDPKESPYLGEALNLNTLSKSMRALKLPQFTFRKKLSHTADSQAQRHRMTPGIRPALYRHIVPGAPDYITPEIFFHEFAQEAKKTYDDEMQAIWNDIDSLDKAGIDAETWQYLLPNAVSVRFTETGPLLDQHHKWTTRLCYNAQEEIWRSTLDEVQQVCEVAPEIGRFLLPPCGLRERAKAKPICPERDRFCGVTVWRRPQSEWLRII